MAKRSANGPVEINKNNIEIRVIIIKQIVYIIALYIACFQGFVKVNTKTSVK